MCRACGEREIGEREGGRGREIEREIDREREREELEIYSATWPVRRRRTLEFTWLVRLSLMWVVGGGRQQVAHVDVKGGARGGMAAQ